MKIRRSMVVLFIIASFVIPISLYRNLFSENASEEFVSTVGIIKNVLMAIFLLLVVAFSIFSDDYPHAYSPQKSNILGFISMMTAAACGYASILGLISDDLLMFSGASGKVFAVLGLFSVLAMMFYAVSFFKGENLYIPKEGISEEAAMEAEKQSEELAAEVQEEMKEVSKQYEADLETYERQNVSQRNSMIWKIVIGVLVVVIIVLSVIIGVKNMKSEEDDK